MGYAIGLLPAAKTAAEAGPGGKLDQTAHVPIRVRWVAIVNATDCPDVQA